MEEKVISEQQPDSTNETTGLGLIPECDEGQAMTPDGKELNGAPADVNKADDIHPTRFDKQEGDENEKGVDRTRSTLRERLSAKIGNKQWAVPSPAPLIDPHGFGDPVCEKFFERVWLAAAVRNTEIYRKVFHAIPDDLGNWCAVGSLRTIFTDRLASDDLEAVQGIRCSS